MIKTLDKERLTPKKVIKFKLLKGMIIDPKRATEGSAGIDLTFTLPFTLNGRFVCQIVPLGVEVEIPKGYVGLLKVRSSVADKHGMFILGGVIDSDYRGELFAKVAQVSGYHVMDFWPGDVLFQLVIVKYYDAEIQVVEELSKTKRGRKGFGGAG